MTVFTLGELFFALAVGLAIGIAVFGGFKAQQKPETLRALEKQMGFYAICLFASGALPSVAMLLVGSLRSAPTSLDLIALVILIGLGVVASYTLFGNALKLLDEHVPR